MPNWIKSPAAIAVAFIAVGLLVLGGFALGGGDGKSKREKRKDRQERKLQEIANEPEATYKRLTPKPDAPNVVFILTDDQPDSSYSAELMPRSYPLLNDEGANFSEAIAAPPLCCPFRAGLVSAQYVQNNGITTNRPGYPKLKQPQLVLPAFMRRAGYRTGFVGKYLNGSSELLGGKPAPGWDRWYELVKRSYSGATISDEGEVEKLGLGTPTTETVTEQSAKFIAEAAGKKRPFFLTTAYYAPHPDVQGGKPCEGRHIAKASFRDYEFAKQFSLPLSRNYGESDVSDKPEQVTKREPLGKDDIAESQRTWRCAVAAMQPVDRGIDDLFGQLRRSGELDNTWVIFGSDNGFNYGEHRLTGKKGFYEEMLQVPLVIRPPTSASRYDPTRGKDLSELVSQVDASATILDIAGAEACLPDLGCREPRGADGRSLLPLLSGSDPDFPADRGIPVQLDKCRQFGLRTRELMLITAASRQDGECVTDFTELYDLRRDPHQLRNIAAERPALTERMRARMERDLQCAGSGNLGSPADGYCE